MVRNGVCVHYFAKFPLIQSRISSYKGLDASDGGEL